MGMEPLHYRVYIVGYKLIVINLVLLSKKGLNPDFAKEPLGFIVG